MPTVIELTEASSGYSAFWGLYSCTVLLSALFVLRECLELVALGPSTYFSSGTYHNIYQPKHCFQSDLVVTKLSNYINRFVVDIETLRRD